MKFAKVFEQTLVEDDVPEEWIEAAIQYKALKKCIGNVVNELNMLGLEQNTLKLLLDKIEVNQDETTASNPVIASYVLRKTSDHEVVPTLKIVVDYNGELTDDYITTSMNMLKQSLEKIVNGSDQTEDEDGEVLSPKTSINKLPSPGKKYEISIRLNSDTKFFEMLNAELNNLDRFKTTEEQKMMNQVEEVSQVLNNISSNSSIKKSDIYTWRELFKMFLDSEVYFKFNRNESQTSERSIDQVRTNLTKYNELVQKSNMLGKFRNKRSLMAFYKFVEINNYLLKVVQFQSINSTAFRKILKKFDKQTSFNVKSRFPKLISDDHIFFSGRSLTQQICFSIQSSLLQIIPQLEDYTCPICLEIAFKPIKLDCGHVFCVRCLVKMKQEERYSCPICRYDKAVELADSGNLDLQLMDRMQKFFPLEIKSKMKERQKERYHDTVGDAKCIIM